MKRSLMDRLRLALVTLPLSCGAQVTDGGNGGDDSSTHWLSGCQTDADCDGLSCLCGVCTRGCENDGACNALGADAVCESACGDRSNTCTRTCERDSECGPGSCSAGTCTFQQDPNAGPTNEPEPESPAAGGRGDDPSPGAGGDRSEPPPQGGSGGNPVASSAAGTSSSGGNGGSGDGGSGGQTGPDPSPPVPTTALTAEQLCEQSELSLDQPVLVDLSGAVTTREVSTAGACPGADGGAAPACCNWTWIAYVVPCEAGDIVLTGPEFPFGTKTAPPGDPIDFGSVEVNMGCQGMDCDPTCVPGTVDDFGVVRAQLEAAEDGHVEPGPMFEPFEALFALNVLESLSTPTLALAGECSALETSYLEEWSLQSECAETDGCLGEPVGLCQVTFSEGTSFGCQLAVSERADLASLRELEGQYTSECTNQPPCSCQLAPAACIDGQCQMLHGPVAEGDLDRCDVYSNDCEVVAYDHCCGLTRRAINSAFSRAYETHPEWQSYDECTPATGMCAPDDQLTGAKCTIAPGTSVGRCELFSTVPL